MSHHNDAIQSWGCLKNPTQHINRPMNTQLYRSFKDKLRLNTSIIVVKWLAKQSCTFRGHDELANLENQGNFGEMIELATKYSKESIEVFLQNSPLYAKCTTSNIQKKLLNIIANKVRNKISEEV